MCVCVRERERERERERDNVQVLGVPDRYSSQIWRDKIEHEKENNL